MISSETSRITYPGNASTTVFAYTFKIFDQDDILVNLVVDSTSVTTTQTVTTHYTVSGVGEESGGNITFITAPPSGTTVVLTRNQPLLQETDYTENDPFPAETHEDALDKCMAAVQMLSERLDRALTIPISSSITNPEVSLTAAKANYYLRANSTGTGFELVEVDTLSGTFADLSADSSPSLGGDLDCAGNDILVTGGSTFLKESTDGNEYFGFTKVLNAVNYFNWSGAATGNGPVLAALGDDANVSININPKGSGTVLLNGPVTSSGLGTFNVGLHIKNGATGGGFARFYEDSDNGTNYIEHKANDTLASNSTYSWPIAPTTTGTHLASDTSGNITHVADKVVQRVLATSTTATSTSTLIPVDNSIPQNTEGTEFLTATITPVNASNKLKIEFYVPVTSSDTAGSNGSLSLFQDTTANALQATTFVYTTSNWQTHMKLTHFMDAGTTSATTFKIRFGPNNGAYVMYMNRTVGTSDIFSTACIASLEITEYSA